MRALCADFETLVVFDTETTGLRPKYDQIIELGAVKYRRARDAFVPDGELSCLVKLPTGRSIPQQIVELTGITQAQLDCAGVTRREGAQKLQEFLSGPGVLCAAYNAQFDLNFVYYFLSSYGFADCLKGIRFFDVLTVYRDRRPYPHRLCNAIDTYRLTGAVNSHRAVDDARAAYLLLEAMAEERDDLAAYVNLFGYHPKYGVSGQRVSSIRYVPQPYDAHPPLYQLAAT